jgi:hypothetical protein
MMRSPAGRAPKSAPSLKINGLNASRIIERECDPAQYKRQPFDPKRLVGQFPQSAGSCPHQKIVAPTRRRQNAASSHSGVVRNSSFKNLAHVALALAGGAAGQSIFQRSGYRFA